MLLLWEENREKTEIVRERTEKIQSLKGPIPCHTAAPKTAPRWILAQF